MNSKFYLWQTSTMQKSPYVIKNHLNERQSQQALALYTEAICQETSKLKLDASQVYKLLRTVIDWRYGMYALCADEVVGLAGYQQPDGSFTGRGNWHTLLRVLGYKSFWKLIHSPLNHGPQRFAEYEMWHNGLYVSSHHRRNGVATALLESVAALAKHQGYQQLSLRVAHDNGSAKALYQALGYQNNQYSTTYQCLTKTLF